MSNFGQDFLNDPLVRNSPSENEIELSVFGKGYGECLVLCCGHQEYIVVDSFINPSTNNPIAIDYLDAIGMPLNSIKEVVLTHWHKDHIEGISTILNNLGSNVKLILSPILKDDQFMEFIFRGIKEGQESTSELKKYLIFCTHMVMVFINLPNKTLEYIQTRRWEMLKFILCPHKIQK